MAKDWSLVTNVIADEVRLELDGRPFIVGIYSHGISARYFPATMPVFSVYIEAKGKKNEYGKCVLSVCDDTGRELARAETQAKVAYAEYPFALLFRLNNVTFPSPGEYKLYLGLDSEPEPISSFYLVDPERMIPPKA